MSGMPANIPVLMAYGQMTVVLMPVLFEASSSAERASWKPTAPNLDVQ